MRQATLVPKQSDDVIVYQVLEDFGKLGRAWREVDEAEANERYVIAGILSGEYEHPIRVVAFNTAEGWSRNVTEDIAGKVIEMAREQGLDLGPSVFEFVKAANRSTAP